MEKYDVVLLPAAYADLDEIFDYIMVDNPRAAARMLDNIKQALRRLESFPYAGAPLLDRSPPHPGYARPEWNAEYITKFEFRMVIVASYIAFYRVINNKVYVYRVLHGMRNYPQLLKG